MMDAKATAEAEATKLYVELGGLLLFSKQLNVTPNVEYWIAQIPVGILHDVWRTQVQLTESIRQDNIPKLAFLCRSALELHIWALYVKSAPDAPKRFHTDAYVDAMEMLKLMDKAFKHISPALHPILQSQVDPLLAPFEQVLIRDKVGCSIDDLRKMKHLNVGDVAKAVGYGGVYEVWNPMLSKLVHATAFSVLVAGNDMNNIGLNLVLRIAEELRLAVKAINMYLADRNLPLFRTII